MGTTMFWTPSRVLLMLALGVLLAAGVSAGSLAFATHGGGGAHFTACLTNGGSLINVAEGDEPAKSCNGNQTEVQWSEEGPQGPQGLQGPAGPPAPGGSTYVRIVSETLTTNSPVNFIPVSVACDQGDAGIEATVVLDGDAESLWNTTDAVPTLQKLLVSLPGSFGADRTEQHTFSNLLRLGSRHPGTAYTTGTVTVRAICHDLTP